MRQNTITRERIIEAALRVVREEGLTGATTRAIVQAVPCAEGTLYLYFKHRTELILALIEESASGFVEHLIRLPQLIGQKTVEENLAMIIRQAARFHDDALTLFCGVISDPELLKAQCRAPNFSTVVRTKVSTDAACVTSVLTNIASPPSFWIISVVSAAPVLTSPIEIFAPCRAKATATGKPT